MTANTINLYTLLNSSFSAEEVDSVLSADNHNHQISWVVSSLEDWQSGDLAVLTSITEKQIKLINASSIPCLVLNGKSDSRMPSVTVLKTELPQRSVIKRLQQTLSDHNAHSNQIRLNIHRQLSELAADGAAIQGIVRALEEITGKGILINDKRMKIIAEQTSPDLADGWAEIVRVLGSFEHLPPDLQDRSKVGEHRISLTQKLSGGLERIIIPVIAGGIARGYLSLIAAAGTLDDVDQAAAEEGALVCAMEMSRAKAVRETEKRLQSDLLTALLQDDISPRDASLWVREIGLDAEQNHTALQFAWSGPHPPTRRRLETIISGEISSLGIKAILNPTGEHVICFCEVPSGTVRPENALALAERVLAQASKEYPREKAYCGIGSTAYAIDQWHVSFREAGQALELAFRLVESKPQYYPDLSVYRLLLQLENDPELTSFYRDVLGKLISEDNKNTLTNTLNAYYENKGNVSQTAKNLFIHRNTLTYRLNKIEEIIGSDLANYDTALSIQLALKIHQMRQKFS